MVSYRPVCIEYSEDFESRTEKIVNKYIKSIKEAVPEKEKMNKHKHNESMGRYDLTEELEEENAFILEDYEIDSINVESDQEKIFKRLGEATVNSIKKNRNSRKTPRKVLTPESFRMDYAIEEFEVPQFNLNLSPIPLPLESEKENTTGFPTTKVAVDHGSIKSDGESIFSHNRRRKEELKRKRRVGMDSRAVPEWNKNSSMNTDKSQLVVTYGREIGHNVRRGAKRTSKRHNRAIGRRLGGDTSEDGGYRREYEMLGRGVKGVHRYEYSQMMALYFKMRFEMDDLKRAFEQLKSQLNEQGNSEKRGSRADTKIQTSMRVTTFSKTVPKRLDFNSAATGKVEQRKVSEFSLTRFLWVISTVLVTVPVLVFIYLLPNSAFFDLKYDL